MTPADTLRQMLSWHREMAYWSGNVEQMSALEAGIKALEAPAPRCPTCRYWTGETDYPNMRFCQRIPVPFGYMGKLATDDRFGCVLWAAVNTDT